MSAATGTTPITHLEAVMGTVVGFTSPDPLPADGIAEAVRRLHEADRVFTTWDPTSPMSRLRAGQVTLDQLDAADAALIATVLDRCEVARGMTGGSFDPWSMPGGVDPTGLVKGWAASRARHALTDAGAANVMVNAGGDIAVSGRPAGGPWRVGIRHPAQPDAYAAVIEVTGAVATSGDYERPGQLIDPATGRTARVAASATVTGPDLDLVDALATGLAVGGAPVLAAIDRLAGYDGYLITDDGRHLATPGMRFVAP
ncbi:MAG TPA: FAD:protein FMN transferase [Acidimicrobiales bacterium]|nr:FAD:protein FMN transferase [Acidimicrobiales bacterium]